MATLQPARTAAANQARYLDLGGQALHIFRFGAPLELAYTYFCDIPAVFRLLPDALDIQPFGPDRYRLIVGATDGHGHSMAAIFDLFVEYEPGRAIRVMHTDDGPPVKLPGLVFGGILEAEAIFQPGAQGTAVEYTVDIAMSIPIPGVLRLMPQTFLQNLGERSMSFKMNQMIGGFTRNITNDFHAWVAGG
jgi:hypothetical protein